MWRSGPTQTWVGARQLHLLAQAEAVGAAGKREHLRLLVLLKDLAARAALVRQVAVVLQKIPDALVENVKIEKRLSLDTGIDILVKLVYRPFDGAFVARFAHTAGERLDAVVERPFDIGGSIGQAVTVRLSDPLLHVVALGHMGHRPQELKTLVQAVEEPFRVGAGQGHHEGQVAERHHAYQHHQFLPFPCVVVGQVERIAGEVYLPFPPWFVPVVVRVVVLFAVLVHVLLELGVAVALGALAHVVVVEDVLHVGVFAVEAFDDLRHHQVQFRLAVVFNRRRLLFWKEGCLEVIVGQSQQASDRLAACIDLLLHGRHQSLAAFDLRTDNPLRNSVIQQLENLFDP